MGISVAKELGKNSEELALEYSNTDNAFVVSSKKTGAGLTHPIIFRRGTDHGVKIDANVIAPVTDGNMKLGLGQSDAGGPLRFTDVNAVLVNGGDFCFENGYRLTEANHVYSYMDPGTGIFLMNPDWEPVLFIDRDGNLLVSGKITDNVKFEKPDIARRESGDGNKCEEE